MTTWSFTSWNDEIQIEDHGEAVRLALILQYLESVRLRAFLDAHVDEIQSAEDVAYDMLARRSVYTAEGMQLDRLGVIVGQERIEAYATDDDAYRTHLLAVIYVHMADGQPLQIYELLEVLSCVAGVQLREVPPAAFEVSVVDCDYPAVVNTLIQGLTGAGIACYFCYSRFPLDETFQASGTYATEEYDADTGAGSVYSAAVGGRSSGVFR